MCLGRKGIHLKSADSVGPDNKEEGYPSQRLIPLGCLNREEDRRHGKFGT